MPALAYFIVRDLIHDRWRSLLTVLSLAVVVVGFLLLACLAGVLQAFGRQSQVTNNLVIISADALDPMESSLSPDLLQTARQIEFSAAGHRQCSVKGGIVRIPHAAAGHRHRPLSLSSA